MDNDLTQQFQALDNVLKGEPQPAPAPVQEETTPTQTEPAAEPAPATAQAEPQTTTEKADPVDPATLFQGAPSNKAFAEMRVQNKQLNTIVQQMARMYGIDPNLIASDKLLPTLQDKLVEAEAKANNIPEDLAKRLAEADRILEETTYMQRSQLATMGFQKIKNDYGLTDEQLTEFAHTLDEQGINPYYQDVDLIEEYRRLYFDQIIEKAKQQALEEATALKNKVDNQSSTPTKAVGATAEPVAPITTVEGLSSWLNKAMP